MFASSFKSCMLGGPSTQMSHLSKWNLIERVRRKRGKKRKEVADVNEILFLSSTEKHNYGKKKRERDYIAKTPLSE